MEYSELLVPYEILTEELSICFLFCLLFIQNRIQ